MRHAVCLSCLLAAGLLLLPAGCPLQLESDTGSIPSSSPSAGGSGSTGSLIPVAPTSGGNTGGTTTTDPVAVSGDTSASSVADVLTTRFPGCNEPSEADFWRSEILRLVNQERQSRGLGTLTWSVTLEDQATEYACEMIHYDFFGHVNPTTGSTLTYRAAEFEYDYWIIGENLAAGQRSPVQAMAGWMDSPCHRENLLNPAFTELGVGIRTGGDYGFYWVQEFGRPFASEPYAGPEYRDPECAHAD